MAGRGTAGQGGGPAGGSHDSRQNEAYLRDLVEAALLKARAASTLLLAAGSGELAKFGHSFPNGEDRALLLGLSRIVAAAALHLAVFERDAWLTEYWSEDAA